MKYAILAVLALLVVAACTQQVKEQVQPVGETNFADVDIANIESCYLAKHVRAGVYNCFGCSNGVCTEPNAKDWTETDQEVAVSKGSFCIASPRGCVLA